MPKSMQEFAEMLRQRREQNGAPNEEPFASLLNGLAGLGDFLSSEVTSIDYHVLLKYDDEGGVTLSVATPSISTCFWVHPEPGVAFEQAGAEGVVQVKLDDTVLVHRVKSKTRPGKVVINLSQRDGYTFAEILLPIGAKWHVCKGGEKSAILSEDQLEKLVAPRLEAEREKLQLESNRQRAATAQRHATEMAQMQASYESAIRQ